MKKMATRNDNSGKYQTKKYAELLEKLPLVGANLLLQFINQFLHPFIILTVLILPESQFFDASLTFPKIFGSITQATLFTIQFSYKIKKYCLVASSNGRY